jgi:hypothetical protein
MGSSGVHRKLDRVSFVDKKPEPNKAPEPTPGSVTLRATLRMTESKQRTAEPNPARIAPAPGVAHL